MEKSEQIDQLVDAVIAVVKEVKNIDKNLKVGEGNMSYKGVADKDVKSEIGQSMAKNGLSIFPTKIEPKTTITPFVDQYGKPKQKVFTEVLVTYLLTHKSGQFITLQGFGHGDDPSDKAAGKATTYALKYTLLYTFLVATGQIDDTDKTHSNDAVVPPVTANPTVPASAIPETVWQAIRDCKNHEQLSNVWANNKDLQKVKQFQDVIKATKAGLPEK